ncbi:hypothetical protein B0H15DRAFT_935345 [Mycena belliarum]|uniref:Protein HGH1 homolog n=1 Tax=Mycena belliarum TaxID=1033014 RepID=A0AAD6TLM5_9AGAR|nr:hypothetical protein B0H15DRAFT_935345 [Mycena belliae]
MDPTPDTEANLRELLPFLRARSPQARGAALAHLLPQTPKAAPFRRIFFAGSGGGLQRPAENEAVRDLKLLCRDQLSVAHDAFRALVNLSDAPMLVAPLSEPPFLAFLVAYIIHPHAVLADLAAMLLSNLTASAPACAALLALTIDVIPVPASSLAPASSPASASATAAPAPTSPSTSAADLYAPQSRCATCPAPTPYPTGAPRAARALPLLVDAFAQPRRAGGVHFLASVFANLAATPGGRNFFLGARARGVFDVDVQAEGAREGEGKEEEEELEYPLAKLLPFTEHADVIRRGGVASTIKCVRAAQPMCDPPLTRHRNCAFHAPGHRALLSADTARVAVAPSALRAPGLDALPALLLPLAGPEELDLEAQEALPAALQFLPPTKARETDKGVRRGVVEALLLLCHTRWGREALRGRGVYEVVRVAHEVEAVDEISELIERLVTLLKGDEPAGAGDGEDEDEAETEVGGDGGAGRQAFGPPVAVGGASGSSDDEDDEDGRIEEV